MELYNIFVNVIYVDKYFSLVSTNVFNDDLNPHIFIYPALIITEFYMTLLDTIDGV